MAARFFCQENTQLGVERWRRNYFANESAAPGLVVGRLVRIPHSPPFTPLIKRSEKNLIRGVFRCKVRVELSSGKTL